MPPVCHRCHGELPSRPGSRGQEDDAALFCPRCSAPQLLLPEHMRVEIEARAEGASTGALPPPRVGRGPGEIEWRNALPVAAGVAAVGALLALAGLRLSGVGLLSVLWVLGGSVIALGFYRKKAAFAKVDARVGFRVGVVTGVLMLAAMAVVGAGAGVILRFATHGMEDFDQRSAEQAKKTQAWGVNFLAQQGEDKAAQARYVEMMNSPLMTAPETRAAGVLASLAFEGLLIVGISAAGGAFAGMLQRRSGGVAQGE